MATAASSSFNLDLAIMVRTRQSQTIIVVNNLDLAAMIQRFLLCLVLQVAIVFKAGLDIVFGWTDSPGLQIGLVWTKHLMIGLLGGYDGALGNQVQGI